MLVGVPKEIKVHEYRVGLTPESVSELFARGHLAPDAEQARDLVSSGATAIAYGHGNQYNVRLDITVPGEEIVVNRDHAEDVYVALRDAFQAARRQLIEHAERGQRTDKTHRLHRRGAAAPEGQPDE